MRKKIGRVILFFLVFMLGFFLGIDWPYYLPPNDFGCYTFDNAFKYVLAEDETRICEIIAILNSDNNIVFNTSGYVGQGWHSGTHKNTVMWGENCYDLFVEDGAGTLDVYLYNGKSWDGPYGLDFFREATEIKALITAAPYELDFNPPFDHISQEYPLGQIPETFINEWKKWN